MIRCYTITLGGTGTKAEAKVWQYLCKELHDARPGGRYKGPDVDADIRAVQSRDLRPGEAENYGADECDACREDVVISPPDPGTKKVVPCGVRRCRAVVVGEMVRCADCGREYGRCAAHDGTAGARRSLTAHRGLHHPGGAEVAVTSAVCMALVGGRPCRRRDVKEVEGDVVCGVHARVRRQRLARLVPIWDAVDVGRGAPKISQPPPVELTEYPQVEDVAIQLCTRGTAVGPLVSVGPWTPAVPDGFSWAVLNLRGDPLFLCHDAFEAAAWFVRAARGEIAWAFDPEEAANLPIKARTDAEIEDDRKYAGWFYDYRHSPWGGAQPPGGSS